MLRLLYLAVYHWSFKRVIIKVAQGIPEQCGGLLGRLWSYNWSWVVRLSDRRAVVLVGGAVVAKLSNYSISSSLRSNNYNDGMDCVIDTLHYSAQRNIALTFGRRLKRVVRSRSEVDYRFVKNVQTTKLFLKRSNKASYVKGEMAR